MSVAKVLFVLTSTSKLGNTGHKTGAYLSEITHAYEEFTNAGYEIEMVSTRGGEVPLDGVKMDDPINATWMNDLDFLGKLASTLQPDQVNPKAYAAVYFVGGHGAMFDLPGNAGLQKVVAGVYANNGVVAAVCHGVAGLTDVRDKNGKYLLQGHEAAGFSNEEEETVGMEKVVPFLLQDRLVERGAHYTSAPKFTAHVVKSGRLITGQNPASTAEVAKAMVETLHLLEEGFSVPDQDWCDWHQEDSKEVRPSV